MKMELKDIKKSFSGTEILHGISVSVESGKALGLLGRNGAGKTTTIRILMDVFRADSGKILIDGVPFDSKKYKIGYLPEERGLYPKKKVKEQVLYLAQLRGIDKKEAIKSIDIWFEKLGVKEYEDKLLESLSKGNQQKVQLAQTLIGNPDIIILDEPFSGLDPVNAQILKDVVQELIDMKKIVIFSSHQMSYVEEFCEDIAIINKGNVILSGNLNDIKKSYGENHIILSAINYDLDELEKCLELNFKDSIEIVNKKKEFLIIKSDYSKNELVQKVIELNIDIETFGIYKPSLNDIFVMKAGDQ